MKKARSRKRPCRVCGRWYVPDARLGDRQKTCGDPECQREWHKRKCAEWNKSNSDYFRVNYLHKKLETAEQSNPVPNASRSEGKGMMIAECPSTQGLLRQEIQEVIGAQFLVIIEYLIRLHIRRLQATMKTQLSVNMKQSPQIPQSKGVNEGARQHGGFKR